jgi:hypothetical protein
MSRQGTRTAAILLEPESFAEKNGALEGAPPPAALPIGELLAGNVLSYVVPCKSDLGLMLGPAGLLSDTASERQTAAAR